MSLSTGEKVRSPPSHVWLQHKGDIEQLYIVQKCTLKEVMKAMEAKGFKASEQQYKIKFSEWQISKYKKRGGQNRAELADASISQTDGRGVANPRLANPQLPNPPPVRTPFLKAPIGDIGYAPTMENLSDDVFNHPHTSEPMNLGIQQGEGAAVPLIPRTPSKRARQPIHEAARSGFVDMVRLLIERDSSCASIPDGLGATPIWTAAYHGHLEVVRLLVKCRGVDVNAAAAEPMRTPIQQAARSGHVDIVKLLLEAGAHKDSYDNKTHSPLWLAAENGHVEVAKLLIQKGADVHFSIHSSERFPIHQAARNGHTDMVRLLIKNGADVDARTKDGWPPLAFAAERNHIGVVNLLLEHNANVNAENKNGSTALFLASQRGHVQIIQKLLDKGAKSLTSRFLQRRPIHQAAESGHLEAVKLLLQQDPCDINIEEENGATPLLLASKGKTASHLETARYLIDHGAAIVLRT